ncbi:anaerobic ribonucleoside-triphosphate reductase activating protein [Cellulosilyticum ruminicola]|uniref:anaerobic ribonucleoside-triphosphate reductase activating protein n=1 Tax=Cellulosilyticum ruminicola TaxID=425254 RepID=UPI0006D2B6DC|nr:anaerobic ribonucleoside-triphosphate reductase activating protein [Cellulosilyticum ruminicola]
MIGTLQVAGFLEHSTVNGEGFRSVLFLSGCPHHCPLCHNFEMQNMNYGEQVDYESILKRIAKVLPLIDGLTLSGGEPFIQATSLIPFLKHIKSKWNLSIWCYTGYTYEALCENALHKELLQLIDVLIDGPFVAELKDANLKYRGSSNQRILKINQNKPPELLYY